ncbi:MAG: glycosyltransferase family 1 protein [Dermatophilaceae bacterium]
MLLDRCGQPDSDTVTATRPLRVLVDATALPKERGGVGRYVDELVRTLPSMGPRVVVAAQQRDQERFARFVGGSAVLTAPAWAGRQAPRLVWEQSGLAAAIRRTRPDVVLSPHYTMPLANVGRGSAPQVVTLHDATFFSHPEVHSTVKAHFFSTWTRVSTRLADALVMPSEATRDEVLAHTHADPRKLFVVPHGVDHESFRPPTEGQVAAARAWAGVPEGVGYLAFLGTLEPRKNVPALIRAFVDSCADRADAPVLVLAGGRGWDDDIDDALAAVPSHITVLRPGFIPDELVTGFLGGADVVTYPSLGEGFGLPVLEAMACGAPVLTTRRLSLPEVGGDAVAYAASPQASDIAEVLGGLLDSRDRRAELSRLALSRSALFTWEATARGHLDVLRQVAT